MVMVPAGNYQIGSNETYPEERPVRRAQLKEFYIDVAEVTCADFKKFVDQTGYVTVAEKQPRASEYPEVEIDSLKPGSGLFVAGTSPKVELCWTYVHGLRWRVGKAAEPVVHIAYEDALAYAKWVGKDLPTEEEWEVAAQGGQPGSLYPWGEDDLVKGKWQANVWQGEFPVQDEGSDGFKGLAPVKSFAPNHLGIFDMIGNAWEWTKSEDSNGKKVLKGGSYLCAKSFCHRYRPSAKQLVEKDSSTCHIGFRCVWRS